MARPGHDAQCRAGYRPGHLPVDGHEFAVQLARNQERRPFDLAQSFPQRRLCAGAHAAQAVGQPAR